MATQVAGELYYEIDGQLWEIKRQLRQPAGYPYDPSKLKIALQNAIEGIFAELTTKTEAIPAKPILILSVVATTQLGAIVVKKTSKCFPKPRYVYRDADFDNWLPVNQSDTPESSISTLAPSQDWTFAEAAAKIIGIGAGTSIKMLGLALIENGHTMTLSQGEEMVEATERSDKTGMRVDGYGNFFFVETANPKNPVAVADVRRGERAWNAYVFRLDDDSRWRADNRLLVRNLDASKLGL